MGGNSQSNPRIDPNSSETVEDTSGYNNVTEIVEIQNLPDKILLQVFEFFTHEEIITQLSLVSRHWHKLARNPSLYRMLVFTRNQPSTRMAVKLVKRAPLLVSLHMCGRVDAGDILRHVGIKTPNLKKLSLDNCIVMLLSMQFLKNCRKLQDICLLGHHYYWVFTEICNKVVKHCQDVETVQCSVIHVDVLSMMCDKFRHSLKVMEISICIGNYESVLPVARCTNITTLHLGQASCISKVSLIAIGDMPNLLDLKVTYIHNMTSEVWMCLFRKPILEKLTKLRLVQCQGVDDDVARVIMKNSKVLKRLYLIDCSVIALTVVEVKQLTSHLNLVELEIRSTALRIFVHNDVYN